MSTTSGVRSLLVALFVAVPACDATSPTAPKTGAGQFTATVNGAMSAQLSGSAISLGVGGSSAGFNIQLRAADSVSAILLVADSMARPTTPKPYPIASTALHGGNAPFGEFTALVTLAGPVVFGSVSGTLTIDASSSSAVSGRFTFIGEDPTDPARAVTVDGTFTTFNEDK